MNLPWKKDTTIQATSAVMKSESLFPVKMIDILARRLRNWALMCVINSHGEQRERFRERALM